MSATSVESSRASGRASLRPSSPPLVTLHIDIDGGTPSQREKVCSFAEKIAQRLFVPTLSPNPLPGHPTGSAVCFSLNYSKVEENRTSVWSGEERDFEDKDMGVAVYIKDIPAEYFRGFEPGRALSIDPSIEDTHELGTPFVVPERFRTKDK